MIRKLFIIVWFGEYPDWLHNWVANMEYLKPLGYDYLIFSNLKLFEQRVRDKLGIEPCIISGTGKPWDFRPAFGVLFEDEIKGYDYWGTTDFDCLYGDINKFMPDEELVNYDIWSNHYCYVCGPWSLYKNTPLVNNLFRECSDWKERMSEAKATGWIETGYSKMVDAQFLEGKINRKYTHFQSRNPSIDDAITFKDGHLYDEGVEIMMFHANRKKISAKGGFVMNPFVIVNEFEQTIAAWAGAKYGVAVESCSAALFLSCLYMKVGEVSIPSHTYPSVPCAIIHAGGTIKFLDEPWQGIYELAPYGIWDGALRFKPDMYKGGLHCLSFHMKKHLPIGRGGMILTDDKEAYNWLKRARFDGRREVPLEEDHFDMLGWNMYMEAEQATRGLRLFSTINQRGFDDLIVTSQMYPDLRKYEVYRSLRK